MKKLVSILLAVAMLLAFALPAMAEDVELDVQITSDIRIDERLSVTEGDFQYYLWQNYGLFDAIVAGKELKDITISDLSWEIYKAYGIDVSVETPPDNQYESPWKVGDSYDTTISITQWKEESETSDTLLSMDAKITVCETKIESVAIKPITIYEGGLGTKDPQAVVTYKDGTVEDGFVPLQWDWEWPTEVGTYEKTAYVYDCIAVPFTITVMEVPTSGKCGDDMNWAYDAASKKLTISGTGDMYEVAKDLDTFWKYEYNYEPEWWYLDVEDVVVEEGVETLSNFAFWMQHKTVQLPSTLKNIPDMGFFVSFEMESLTIPEGITSLTGWPFGSPGNSFCSLKEIHLPASMKQIDAFTLLTSGINSRNGEVQLETVYFAGSPSEWAAVEWVRSDFYKILGENYDGYINDEWYAAATESLSNVKIVCAKSDIPVENGTATIPESAVEITEGKDVVIDVTDTKEEVSSVVITPETVEKITDAAAPVQVKLPEVTVSFDKTAIGSIGEQAGQAAVTIVAKEIEKTALNDKQKGALEKKEVVSCLSLEAYADTAKITDFGGGKVTVSVPFELPKDTKGDQYYVAYVADDGTITAMPTQYKDGVLSFETTHFSHYVVLKYASDNPNTGDVSILLSAVLMVISGTGMGLCITKRKDF